ncbi:MAG: dihydroxyacetone kinase subunit DhaL [Chloroflexota bacterium]|nr:dihydroxyacetone kinase subunit DhaL [Chloroflexota bacterium]
MTTTLTRDQVAALLGSVADLMIAQKDELATLDADLGDGDLGRTIERGFLAIKTALADPNAPAGEDIGRMLFRLGKAFSNDAASSFGALFGTALMKGGMALKDKHEAALSDFADATDTALKALMERGKAKLGDKTMLDAIAPALDAMRAAAADAPVSTFFRTAADAAQLGAVATQNMQSQIGRASWQGERSAGKMDPGARAIAMMLDAAAKSM